MGGAGGAELILRSVQHLQRLFWSSNAYVWYDWQLFSLAGNISNASIYRIIMENKSAFSLLLS